MVFCYTDISLLDIKGDGTFETDSSNEFAKQQIKGEGIFEAELYPVTNPNSVLLQSRIFANKLVTKVPCVSKTSQ